MPEQRDITDMGGTMRLGLYPCELQPRHARRRSLWQWSMSRSATATASSSTTTTARLLEAGRVRSISGLSPDGRLVEIIELRDHPWFVGTQFHPEFLSRPNRPHPLFRDFRGGGGAHLPRGRPAPAAAGGYRQERQWRRDLHAVGAK